MSKEYEKDIICPYCNYEFSDSWEYNDEGDKEIECGECEKEFTLSVEFDVTYSTHRMDCKTHSYEKATSRDIQQDTCDRWNEKNFCSKSDHVPHTMWTKNCKNCEKREHKETDIGEPNPFECVTEETA